MLNAADFAPIILIVGCPGSIPRVIIRGSLFDCDYWLSQRQAVASNDIGKANGIRSAFGGADVDGIDQLIPVPDPAAGLADSNVIGLRLILRVSDLLTGDQNGGIIPAHNDIALIVHVLLAEGAFKLDIAGDGIAGFVYIVLVEDDLNGIGAIRVFDKLIGTRQLIPIIEILGTLVHNVIRNRDPLGIGVGVDSPRGGFFGELKINADVGGELVGGGIILGFIARKLGHREFSIGFTVQQHDPIYSGRLLGIAVLRMGMFLQLAGQNPGAIAQGGMGMVLILRQGAGQGFGVHRLLHRLKAGVSMLVLQHFQHFTNQISIIAEAVCIVFMKRNFRFLTNQYRVYRLVRLRGNLANQHLLPCVARISVLVVALNLADQLLCGFIAAVIVMMSL